VTQGFHVIGRATSGMVESLEGTVVSGDETPLLHAVSAIRGKTSAATLRNCMAKH